jgi:hypothetical protein
MQKCDNTPQEPPPCQHGQQVSEGNFANTLGYTEIQAPTQNCLSAISLSDYFWCTQYLSHEVVVNDEKIDENLGRKSILGTVLVSLSSCALKNRGLTGKNVTGLKSSLSTGIGSTRSAAYEEEHH